MQLQVPSIRLKAGAAARWRRQLAHRLTMEDETATSDTPSGVAVWTALLREQEAIVSWRWVMVDRSLPVLANPLGIQSNIVFVDEDGRPLAPGRMVLELGSLVCGLQWQQRVPRR